MKEIGIKKTNICLFVNLMCVFVSFTGRYYTDRCAVVAAGGTIEIRNKHRGVSVVSDFPREISTTHLWLRMQANAKATQLLRRALDTQRNICGVQPCKHTRRADVSRSTLVQQGHN